MPPNFAIDGSVDRQDNDGDQANNWQEWRAGTDPTNPVSVLQLLSPVADSAGVWVSWRSVSGRTYYLERSTQLPILKVASPWLTNIVAQSEITTVLDSDPSGGTGFYRVGIE